VRWQFRWKFHDHKLKTKTHPSLARLDFETRMKLAQTNLSKLKACGKLAGGKAAGRHPRSKTNIATTLMGWWKRRDDAGSGTPSGCGNLWDLFPGYRFAQPRANFRQPFRLLQMAPART
jgi:hypothetical protein